MTPVIHYVDPDKDGTDFVQVLRTGDRLSVLFREDDVALTEFPTGLMMVRVEPHVFTPPGNRDMQGHWGIYEATMSCSVRLDRVIDTSFRQYRAGLEEFYEYRAGLLKRPTCTSTVPTPTRRRVSWRIGRSGKGRGRRTTDGQ